MSLDGVRCVGYVRVSDAKQAGEALTSPADQRAAIEARAAKLGVRVECWYQDELSGGSAEKRPALNALIADCEASPRGRKHPGYVIALNDSRWGRFPDPEESAYWRTYLRKRCGWLVWFAENDDVEDPKLRTVMRAIVATQATQKREDVRANATRGSRGTASQGFWGTRSPYGYRRKVVYPQGRERVLEAHQRKAPDEKVALTPHTGEARIVRDLFSRYASGTESIASLTDWLRSASPERKWTRAAVKFTLTNPAYVGDVVSGRVSSEHRERRPESEWVTHRNAHPAIVDRALFARCQDVLARNAKWTTRVRTDWVVSGIVTCPCGKPYVAGGANSNARGDLVRSYRCATKTGIVADRCAFPGSIKKEWLERAVIDTVASVVGSPAQRRRVQAHLHALLAERRARPADSLASLSVAITDASAARDRLVAAVADGTLTGDEAKARLTTVRRQIARLESQRDALVPTVETTRALEAERAAITAQVLDFRGMASLLRGPALREMIRPWIASAAFDPISRKMWLEVRHFPALPHGALSSMAWPADQKDSAVTRRQVRVGGSL